MKTTTLPSRPAKSFGEIVTLPALAESYDSMPKVNASEVFNGLKGKADKGENFTRFAFLAWKGSINADQVKSAFAGALRVAMLAAFHAAIQGRDQNAALPGEVVGRAWGAASIAWGGCPERAAKAPANKSEAPASTQEGTASTQEGTASAQEGTQEGTQASPEPMDAAMKATEARYKVVLSQLEEAESLLERIASASNIRSVRTLLQQSGYLEAKAA